MRSAGVGGRHTQGSSVTHSSGENISMLARMACAPERPPARIVRAPRRRPSARRTDSAPCPTPVCGYRARRQSPRPRPWSAGRRRKAAPAPRLARRARGQDDRHKPQSVRIGARAARVEQVLQQGIGGAREIAFRAGAIDHPGHAHRLHGLATARPPTDRGLPPVPCSSGKLAGPEVKPSRCCQGVDSSGDSRGKAVAVNVQ